MLNSMNVVGRLTKDPDLRVTQSNIQLARFSIACERNYKNAQGTRDADFIDVMAWKQLAKIVCQYMHKGDMISVSGRIETNMYKDKNGNSRKSVYINADEVQLVSYSKNNQQQQQQQQQQPYQPPVQTPQYTAPQAPQTTQTTQTTQATTVTDPLNPGVAIDLTSDDLPF